MNKTQMLAELREEKLLVIGKFLESIGDEVLRTDSNTISVPMVDKEGNEGFFKITVAIPRGDGSAPYDGYHEANCYAKKVEEDKAKKEKRQKEKEAAAAKRAERLAKKKAEKEKEEGE